MNKFMAAKYPIGIQDFGKMREDGYIYIDKTDLIYKLANEGNYYFLSRPRRFGKSLLLSTMAAYFSGRRDLFKGLAIEQLEKDWTAYPILYVDLNTGKYDSADALNEALEFQVSSFEKLYGAPDKPYSLPLRFTSVIEKAYQKPASRWLSSLTNMTSRCCRPSTTTGCRRSSAEY